MQRYFFSLRLALLTIAAGIAVAAAGMWWRGFVVIHDPDGLIGGAVLEGDLGQRRPLREFAAGYWATTPAFDGAVRLYCRNGAQPRRGDVVPGRQTGYTVVPRDCPARRRLAPGTDRE